MARIVLSLILSAMVVIVIGCHDVDSGASQILQTSSTRVEPAPLDTEVDIIERMAESRQAYRKYLVTLIENYKKMGNNMKLAWAEDELEKLNEVPQYNYIIEACIPGPELKASWSVELADYMYADAVALEDRARRLILIQNEDELRLALQRYNQLIQKHPTSDKIDDAAFKAAGICEYFNDYTVALLYYQRAYQWDPDTPYPAKYKAARILDEKMSRKREALELYRQALERQKLNRSYKEFAKKRIAELTRKGEKLE